MSTELSIEQLNDLRQRILAHRRGEGPKPSVEELRAAYSSIRKNRTAATAAKKTAKTSTAKPAAPVIDLDALFKPKTQ